MLALRKAVVRGGKLIVEDPTDLPEGAEVEIAVLDDELSTEERAELHASLDRALDDSKIGNGSDVWDFLSDYRNRRAHHHS